MDIVPILTSLGGIASTAEIRRRGVTSRDLARARQAGHVLYPARGFYCLPDTDRLERAERIFRVERTCVTALRRLGLPAPTRDSRFHVAIALARSTGGRHRQLPDSLHPHWFAVPPHGGSEVLRALDSSSRCLTRLHQLIAVDAALAQGILAAEDIDGMTITPRRRRAWLRRFANAGSQSPPETKVRVALLKAELRVEVQVIMPSLGRADMVVNDALVVEVDGRTYHMNERSFENDRRRDRVALGVYGLPTIRFTRHDVDSDIHAVVADVKAALMRLGALHARVTK